MSQEMTPFKDLPFISQQEKIDAAASALMLGNRVDILDHGYLQLIEHWGSDQCIVESARMSTGKGFNGWGGSCVMCNGTGTFSSGLPEPQQCGNCEGTGALTGDEKLLKYLYDNKHATPFEFGGLTIEVQAPIMVFREWHRHRTQGYNEASARYAPLPAFDYLPTRERVLTGGGHLTKQAGSMVEGLTAELADEWLRMLDAHYHDAEEFYQWGLTHGIPKELARLGMPVGRYSKMRATCNLRNWLGFLTLRMDPKAQYEIRVYAQAVGKLIEQVFPRTWELFEGGRK